MKKKNDDERRRREIFVEERSVEEISVASIWRKRNPVEEKQ